MIRTNAFNITPHQPERLFQPVNNALMQYRQGMDRKTARDDRLEAQAYQRHEGEKAREDSRNALMYNRKRDQEKFDYRKRRDALADARANKTLAMQMREHQAKMRPQPASAGEVNPFAGYGLDKDGNVVPPRVSQRKVLADGDTLGATTSYGTPRMDFGQRGVAPADVPGVVTNPKSEGSDRFATERNESQKAISGATPEQQARMNEVWQNQKRWRLVFGKPPSGKFYGPNGELLDLAKSNLAGKPSSSFAAASQGVRHVAMQSVDDAIERVKKSNLPERFLSMTLRTGDFDRMNNSLQLAIKGVAHGLSGAAMSFREIETYLNAFMPSSIDHGSTIEFKLAHLKRAIAGIQQISTGQADKRLLHDLRNDMRKGIGLGARPFEPEEKVDPLTRRGTAETEGAPDLSQMSDDDLLRALQQ